MANVEKRVLRSALWRELTKRRILPWVLSFGDLPPRATVLEVGAGAGFNAETLLDRFGGWRLVTTDYDADMVEQAAERLQRFGDRALVERADATALPYDSASFDAVLSLGVWHHVGEWERALAECARVLVPGGRLLLVDLLPGFFKGPVAKLFPPERTYDLGDLRAQLGKAGFARFRIKAAGTLWYRLVADMPND